MSLGVNRRRGEEIILATIGERWRYGISALLLLPSSMVVVVVVMVVMAVPS